MVSSSLFHSCVWRRAGLGALALLLAGPPPAFGQDPVELPSPGALVDLRVVLDTGVVLQDRNQDGIVDHLDVRILLAADPTEVELAAAANVAARLGFETSGTGLGLAGVAEPGRSHETPVFLMGIRSVEVMGMEEAVTPVREKLAPGQGALVALPPGGGLPRGGVAVVGYDATGLLEAAAYLAARYPGVWEPGSTPWDEVVERVEGFARGRGLTPSRISLDRIVVDGNNPGIQRARVALALSTEDGFDGAVAAFSGEDSGSEGDAADASPPAEAVDTAVSPGTATPSPPAEGASDEESIPEFKDLHRLDVLLLGPTRERTLNLRPESPWETGAGASYRPGTASPFFLPQVYEVGGLYRDTNRDLVPDETAAFISLSGGNAPGPVTDLATRIGLETAGIRLPLVRVEAEENDPTSSGFPILVGVDHYQIHRLQEESSLPGSQVGPGEGFVQIADRAFGEGTALVVGGGDDRGLAAATSWLATRAPYLWTHGKGEYRLEDAETEVRHFLQGRRGPGQAALALAKLDSWLGRMEDDPPARLEVELAVQEADPALTDLASSMIRDRFPEAEARVDSWSTGFGLGDTVFVHEWEIPWEVDEVRDLLEREVYPRVRTGAPASVEVRVSEPPEIRAALEGEIQEALDERGAGPVTVHVLSAYKQGYSWINDVLLPRLREIPVASVDLTYHTLEESEEVRWQTIAAETRWLQEVYPMDAVLARELQIPDSAITFHPTRTKEPIYTLEARDQAGEVVLRETFDPKYVVRPFFDLFPEYEQVRVTTGWVMASSGGETLLDRRIVTDPERFWDRLQSETYPEIAAYFMDIQDGDPSGGNAPFFDAFQVDLRLSEPDYRIGVDEETISSLEALHEDLYFETHTLFTLLGGRYQTSVSNPGRVLPFVDPSGAGEPGRARLVLTGKPRARPELVVRQWVPGGEAPRLQRYDLSPLPTEDVGLAGVRLIQGQEGIEQMLVRVTVPDSLDRFDEFAVRSSESSIDREFLSVELLEKMIGALRRLHDGGFMEDALSWDRVGELAFDFRLEEDSTYQKTVTLERSAHPGTTVNPRLDPGSWTYAGEPMVQWDHPISIEENEEILARLGTFPGVNAYYLTDSYLGNRVWAADFLAPHEAPYVSQAKLNALKPTLLVSGREHANEVSSTSHILRLGELLVTDSAHQEMLKKVNVVLHPITNPDGAALAYARQLVNPDHMLHAGRPGALGQDATSGAGSDDPVYPESQARVMLREAWLPDIYLNPHGYPSHEWVQYFAGYSAWARGRRVGPRTWWVPRGWFIPGFSWVDDEENPEYKTAQFAILDSMAAAVTGNPEVDDLNRRLYARYRKYGEQDRDGFTEYFHNGMVVNLRLRGNESIGTGVNSPRITYFSTTTEAPDETARGDYLRLMGEVGLAHVSSALRYLASGEFEVKREAEAFDGAVVRKIFRIKPVLPPGANGGEDPGPGEGRDPGVPGS